MQAGMAIINKSTHNKCWPGCGEREALAFFAGMQTGAAAVECCMEIPQKIKNGTALGPSDSTSGNSSEETQNTNAKEYKHVPVLCSIVYDSQDMEAAQVSTSR